MHAKKLEKEGKEILKLNIGDPIAFDFDTPEFIKQAIFDAVNEGYNGYTSSEGDSELLDTIVRRERAMKGVTLDDDRIIVTAGVSEALNFLFNSLLERGDQLLVPGPGYPPYIALTKFVGGVPVSYKTDEENGWQPDVDDIRNKITEKTRAIVVINPNNPTGAVYNKKTLKSIIDIAGEYSIPVISDEIYDSLVYDGQYVSPLTLTEDVDIILLNGLSKVYMAPGWRLGYMAFYSENNSLDMLYEGCIKQARIRLCANTPAQRAAIAALSGPQDHITENIKKLKKRRDYIAKRFSEIDGISLTTPKGAFYGFPRIERDYWKTDLDFVLDVLNTIHVLFVHGSGFCPVYGRNHFRLVFLPPLDTLELAFERLEEFMRVRI